MKVLKIYPNFINLIKFSIASGTSMTLDLEQLVPVKAEDIVLWRYFGVAYDADDESTQRFFLYI